VGDPEIKFQVHKFFFFFFGRVMVWPGKNKCF